MMIHTLARTETDLERIRCSGPLQHWLTEKELSHYNGLHSDKRKSDWLLGRLAAKELIQAVWLEKDVTTPSLVDVEVLNHTTGKPFFSVRSGPDGWLKQSLSISITHRDGIAWSACTDQNVYGALGVDVETVKPRPTLFADTFFRESENECLASLPLNQRDSAITALWSLKEACLKALGVGLNRDTRDVEIAFKPLAEGFWIEQEATLHLSGQWTAKAWVQLTGLTTLSIAWINHGPPVQHSITIQDHSPGITMEPFKQKVSVR